MADTLGQTNVSKSETSGNQKIDLSPIDNIGSNTELEDIPKAYSNVGAQYRGIVEDAYNNVFDRQTARIGNDFGKSPYMFNTYYEPASTSFDSTMRVQGTQAALDEGMKRGKKAAEDKLNAAKSNYKQSVEQAQRRALAVAEIETGLLGDGNEVNEVNKIMDIEGKTKEQYLQENIGNATWDNKDLGINWDNQDRWHNIADSVIRDKWGNVDAFRAMSKEEQQKYWDDPEWGNLFSDRYARADIYAQAGQKGLDAYNEAYKNATDALTKVYDYLDGKIEDIWLDQKQLELLTINSPNKTLKEIVESGVDDISIDNVAEIVKEVSNPEWIDENIKDEYKDEVAKVLSEQLNKNLLSTNKEEMVQNMNDTLSTIYKTLSKRTKKGTSVQGLSIDEERFALEGQDVKDITGFDMETLRWYRHTKETDPDRLKKVSHQIAMAYGKTNVIEVADGKTEYMIGGKKVKLEEGQLVTYALPGAVNSDGTILDKNFKQYVDCLEQQVNASSTATDEEIDNLEKATQQAWQEYMKTAYLVGMAEDYTGTHMDADLYHAVLYSMHSDDKDYRDLQIAGKSIKDYLGEWREKAKNDGHAAYKDLAALLNKSAANAGYFYATDSDGQIVRQSTGNIPGTNDKTIGAVGEDESTYAENMSPAQAYALFSVISQSMTDYGNGNNVDINVNPYFIDDDKIGLAQEFSNTFLDMATGTLDVIQGLFAGISWLKDGITKGDWDISKQTIYKWNDVIDGITTGDWSPSEIGEMFGGAPKEGSVKYTIAVANQQQENLAKAINPVLDEVFFPSDDKKVRRIGEGYTTDRPSVVSNVPVVGTALDFLGISQIFAGGNASKTALVNLGGTILGGFADAFISKGIGSATKLGAKAIISGTGKAADAIVGGAKSAITKAALGKADDVAKVIADKADDAARVINKADDAVKAGAEKADDVVKAVANKTDDAAKVGVEATETASKSTVARDAVVDTSKAVTAQEAYVNSRNKVVHALAAASDAVETSNIAVNAAKQSTVNGANAINKSVNTFGKKLANATIQAVESTGATLNTVAKENIKNASNVISRAIHTETLQNSAFSLATGLPAESFKHIDSKSRRLLSKALSLSGQGLEDGKAFTAKGFFKGLSEEGASDIIKTIAADSADAVRAGHKWSMDDTVRILVNNGWEGGYRNKLIKEYAKDFAHDMFMDAYRQQSNPMLTNEGWERQSLDEYFLNPLTYVQNITTSAAIFGLQRVKAQVGASVSRSKFEKAAAALQMAGEESDTATKALKRYNKAYSTYQKRLNELCEKGYSTVKAREQGMAMQAKADQVLYKFYDSRGLDMDGRPVECNFKSSDDMRRFMADKKIKIEDRLNMATMNMATKSQNMFMITRGALGGADTRKLGNIRTHSINFGITETLLDAADELKGLYASNGSKESIMKNQRAIYAQMVSKAVEKHGKVVPGLEIALNNFFDTLADDLDARLTANPKAKFQYGYMPIDGWVSAGDATAVGFGSDFGNVFTIDRNVSDSNKSRKVTARELLDAAKSGASELTLEDGSKYIINADGFNFASNMQAWHNAKTVHEYLDPIFGNNVQNREHGDITNMAQAATRSADLVAVAEYGDIEKAAKKAKSQMQGSVKVYEDTIKAYRKKTVTAQEQAVYDAQRAQNASKIQNLTVTRDKLSKQLEEARSKRQGALDARYNHAVEVISGAQDNIGRYMANKNYADSINATRSIINDIRSGEIDILGTDATTVKVKFGGKDVDIVLDGEFKRSLTEVAQNGGDFDADIATRIYAKCAAASGDLELDDKAVIRQKTPTLKSDYLTVIDSLIEDQERTGTNHTYEINKLKREMDDKFGTKKVTKGSKNKQLYKDIESAGLEIDNRKYSLSGKFSEDFERNAVTSEVSGKLLDNFKDSNGNVPFEAEQMVASMLSDAEAYSRGITVDNEAGRMSKYDLINAIENVAPDAEIAQIALQGGAFKTSNELFKLGYDWNEQNALLTRILENDKTLTPAEKTEIARAKNFINLAEQNSTATNIGATALDEVIDDGEGNATTLGDMIGANDASSIVGGSSYYDRQTVLDGVQAYTKLVNEIYGKEGKYRNLIDERIKSKSVARDTVTGNYNKLNSTVGKAYESLLASNTPEANEFRQSVETYRDARVANSTSKKVSKEVIPADIMNALGITKPGNEYTKYGSSSNEQTYQQYVQARKNSAKSSRTVGGQYDSGAVDASRIEAGTYGGSLQQIADGADYLANLIDDKALKNEIQNIANKSRTGIQNLDPAFKTNKQFSEQLKTNTSSIITETGLDNIPDEGVVGLRRMYSSLDRINKETEMWNNVAEGKRPTKTLNDLAKQKIAQVKEIRETLAGYGINSNINDFRQTLNNLTERGRTTINEVGSRISNEATVSPITAMTRVMAGVEDTAAIKRAEDALASAKSLAKYSDVLSADTDAQLNSALGLEAGNNYGDVVAQQKALTKVLESHSTLQRGKKSLFRTSDLSPMSITSEEVFGDPTARKIGQGTRFNYVDGFEVSTAGDRTYSAKVAKLSKGTTIEINGKSFNVGDMTIEDAYQKVIKQSGKGKAPAETSPIYLGKDFKGNVEDYSYEKAYLPLWKKWAEQNPGLVDELRTKSEGKTLTDKFANTRVSQARALSDILNKEWVVDSNVYLNSGIGLNEDADFSLTDKGGKTVNVDWTTKEGKALRNQINEYFAENNLNRQLDEDGNIYVDAEHKAGSDVQTDHFGYDEEDTDHLVALISGKASRASRLLDSWLQEAYEKRIIDAEIESGADMDIVDADAAFQGYAKDIDTIRGADFSTEGINTDLEDAIYSDYLGVTSTLERWKANDAKLEEAHTKKLADIDKQLSKLDVDDAIAKKALTAEEYADYKAKKARIQEADDFINKKTDVFTGDSGMRYVEANSGAFKGYINLADRDETLKTFMRGTDENTAEVALQQAYDSKANAKARKQMQKNIDKNQNAGSLHYKNTEGYDGVLNAKRSDMDIKSARNSYGIGKHLRNQANDMLTADGMNAESGTTKYMVSKSYSDSMDRIAESSGAEPTNKFETLRENFMNMKQSCIEFNKTIQDWQMAGGFMNFNAATLAQIRGAIFNDPLMAAKYINVFVQARNSNTAMMAMMDLRPLLNEIMLATGDVTVLTDLNGVFQKGAGTTMGITSQIMDNHLKPNKEGGFHPIKSTTDDVSAVFNDPTFVQALPLLKARMFQVNYDEAVRFVNKNLKNSGLSGDELHQLALKYSYAKTTDFFEPRKTRGQSFDSFMDTIKDEQTKKAMASWTGAKHGNTIMDVLGSAFFALRWKMTFGGRVLNGLNDMPGHAARKRAMKSGKLSGDSLANVAGTQFMRSGNRAGVMTMIGLSALAYAVNSSLGYNSIGLNDLSPVGDDGEPQVPPILLKFQTLGQFWLPNDTDEVGNPKINPNKQMYDVDNFSSIFTIPNSLARAVDKAINPNAYNKNMQRGAMLTGQSNNGINSFLNSSPMQGLADLISSNLLSPYKAAYEVFMNDTYYGNNIWERKILSDGSTNPNYDPFRNTIAGIAHITNLDWFLSGGTNKFVKGYGSDTYQNTGRIGTVAGSGILQHEFVSAAIAIAQGETLEGIIEGGELPLKTRNLSGQARTEFNTKIKNAITEYAAEYKDKVANLTDPSAIDEAYKDFVTKSANIIANWSSRNNFVLGQNQELVGYVAKMTMAICAGEYDDGLDYIQTAYWKASKEAQVAAGEKFFLDDEDKKAWIESGKTAEEFANEKNRRTAAYNKALDDEYKARIALKEAGLPEEYLAAFEDKYVYENFQVQKRGVNREVFNQVKAALTGQVGEFKNFKEMQAYYKEMIDAAPDTKTKAYYANKYNDILKDTLSPYITKYGDGMILSDGYYNGENLSNVIAEYVIIPADKKYAGKAPRANYLKDMFGVGYRNSEHLLSDKDALARMNAAAAKAHQGATASSVNMLERLISDYKAGRVYLDPSDYSRIVNMKAQLSARSK